MEVKIKLKPIFELKMNLPYGFHNINLSANVLKNNFVQMHNDFQNLLNDENISLSQMRKKLLSAHYSCKDASLSLVNLMINYPESSFLIEVVTESFAGHDCNDNELYQDLRSTIFIKNGQAFNIPVAMEDLNLEELLEASIYQENTNQK